MHQVGMNVLLRPDREVQRLERKGASAVELTQELNDDRVGCDLADALEMCNVLIPVFPGGLSALGILRADVVKELSHTVLLSAEEISESPRRLSALLNPLAAQATRVLRIEGFERHKMRLQHTLDMRYLGQAYELNIAASGNIIAAFHRAHELRYGYHNEKRQIEIVNVRCRAIGVTEKPPTATIAGRRRGERVSPAQTLQLMFDGRLRKALLYPREALHADDMFSGPAVVTEYSATTLIPPGWNTRVNDYGQLLLSRK